MKKKGVVIIIENEKGEILLQLRDDKPTIPYPNKWVLFGGRAEENESFEEAIKREMQEEIELNLKTFKLFRIYEWKEETEHVFYVKIDLDPKKIVLHEGKELKYFSKEEIEEKEIITVPKDKIILKDFFSLQT